MSVYLSNQPDPDAVAAALATETVHSILLLELQLASGTIYLSNSAIAFTDAQWGQTWAGLGNLVSLSAIEGGPDDLAPVMEYGLGVPWEMLTDDEQADLSLGLIPALVTDRPNYIGRPAILWDQVLSDDVLDEHGRPSPVGVPSALHFGLMDQVRVSFSATHASLTMSVEGPLARKGFPVNGRLTDRDQKRRSPGDTFLEHVPEVMSTAPVWTDW